MEILVADKSLSPCTQTLRNGTDKCASGRVNRVTDSQGRSEPCGFTFPPTTLFIFPHLEMRPGDDFPRREMDENKTAINI